ncbi:hypothetical protein BDZ97DRAFT_1755428 [Flammula alnicola]|nr:hypothetical protein BDZ97DRAFT_1755428 [Flammula alnicola]
MRNELVIAHLPTTFDIEREGNVLAKSRSTSIPLHHHKIRHTHALRGAYDQDSESTWTPYARGVRNQAPNYPTSESDLGKYGMFPKCSSVRRITKYVVPKIAQSRPRAFPIAEGSFKLIHSQRTGFICPSESIERSFQALQETPPQALGTLGDNSPLDRPGKTHTTHAHDTIAMEWKTGDVGQTRLGLEKLPAAPRIRLRSVFGDWGWRHWQCVCVSNGVAEGVPMHGSDAVEQSTSQSVVHMPWQPNPNQN